MKSLKIASLILLIATIQILPQTEPVEVYKRANEALQSKDTTLAVTLFQKSIKLNDDAPSYFELAKISIGKKTILELNKAKDYVDKALDIDPNNIYYLSLQAYLWEEQYWTDRQYFVGRTKAINIYERILELDNNNREAMYNLGRLNVEEFIEYRNAAVKMTINKSEKPIDKLTKYRGRSSLKDEGVNAFFNAPDIFPRAKLTIIAYSFYSKAQNDLEKSIENNSQSIKAYEELGILYTAAGEFEKVINVLSSLSDEQLLSKNVHLCLGLAYHKINEDEKASLEFQKAISLMNDNEKNDFTVNSVKLLLLSKIGDKIYEMSKEQLLPYITGYWNSNDPLILTSYNERLIEHYSRVTYANFFFGSRRLKVDGWKTDRGEVLLRYGFPKEIECFVTETEKDIITDKPKTELWTYEDNYFVFVDAERNRSYRFAQPWNSMLTLDTSEEIINLRRTKPEEYFPSFEGPIFNLSYQTYQFASKYKKQTDVFLSYGINYLDTTTTREKFEEGYDVGLFMFDNNFNKKFENKKRISSTDNISDIVVNTLEMSLLPLSGNLAFEIERKKDKGVTAYHGKYNVKDYSSNELQISDIVLASRVETDHSIYGAIKRNDISILPNPTMSFSKNDEFFLYYEVYNLTKNTNKTTDFEQKITIQKKEESGVLSSVLSVVGLDKKGEKVSLTSRYQAQEKDPQMYLQLDMSKYEEGEYVITVTIKDLVTGKETSSQTEIIWQK